MSNIHQEVTLSAAPARIYEALVDSKRFGELTGAPAQGESLGRARPKPEHPTMIAEFRGTRTLQPPNR